jgi:hypothetical protein
MNGAISPRDHHLCPDCQSEETRGRDKFGFPMPCARCLVDRLVKAFHADLEEQAVVWRRVPEAAWSRQSA